MEGCQIPHIEAKGEPLCLLLLEVSGVPRNCRQACLELLPTEGEFISPSLVTMELVRAQAHPEHKRASPWRCEPDVLRRLENSSRRYRLSKYDSSTPVFGVLDILGRAVRNVGNKVAPLKSAQFQML